MKLMLSLILVVFCTACGNDSVTKTATQSSTATNKEVQQPEAEFDIFRMGNPEIREDLLAQFEKHGIEYWLEEGNTIRFRKADTKQVDRIVYEAIGVYAASQ